MSALLVALGLALLLVALIAVAKLTFDQARRSSLRREHQVRRPVVMDERIRARLEATIWPD
jgi:Tfp pilus assembly protein PilX